MKFNGQLTFTTLPGRFSELGRFLTFLVVGGINMLVGYALFAILFVIGLGTTISLLCATVLGVVFNFQTTGRFVFRGEQAAFRRFLMVYAAQFGLNWLALKALGFIDVGPLAAQLIVLPPLAIATYGAIRRWVFTVRS